MQISLYSYDQRTGVAKARTKDPETSHLAAEKVESSGKGQTDRDICLALVKRHPGSTSAEIASMGRLDRYIPSRRLPELRELGLVINGLDDDGNILKRKCHKTGNLMMIWFVGDNAP